MTGRRVPGSGRRKTPAPGAPADPVARSGGGAGGAQPKAARPDNQNAIPTPGVTRPERVATMAGRRTGSVVPVPRQIQAQGSYQSGICPGPIPHGYLLGNRPEGTAVWIQAPPSNESE